MPRPVFVLLGCLVACAALFAQYPADAQEDAVDPARAEQRVRETLDALHAAAAAADEERYFALYAPDAIFLGTDASERWTQAAFQEYAHPHFAEGRGWTYRATERHVFLGPDARLAWFDERLENAKLGECRGSGVLRRDEGAWRVVQYNLTIPIPNDLAIEFVERIRSGESEGE